MQAQHSRTPHVCPKRIVSIEGNKGEHGQEWPLGGSAGETLAQDDGREKARGRVRQGLAEVSRNGVVGLLASQLLVLVRS